MKIKHIKLIFFFIVFFAFILFFVKGYQMDKKAQTAFIEKEFHGIIMEIKYIEGRRGFPDLKINGEWIYLGLNGEKIQNYIEISDSIIKRSGTETIKVYKKNSKGVWIEKVFK